MGSGIQPALSFHLPVWDPHRPGTMFRVSTMTCVGLQRGQKISSRTGALHRVIVMEIFACKTHIPSFPNNLTSLLRDVSSVTVRAEFHEEPLLLS